jgi:hypothetical protein
VSDRGDKRKIGWMKEIWKRKERIGEGEGWGIETKTIIFLNFFELLIYVYVYICMFIMYFGIRQPVGQIKHLFYSTKKYFGQLQLRKFECSTKIGQR